MENSFRLGARKMIAAAASVVLAASLCTVPVTAYADETTSDTEAALAKVNELMSEIDSANADYLNALDEQAAAEKKAKEAKATIKAESAKIEKNQDKLSSRVRSMYKADKAPSWMCF
ncbi:MAG: coiled-coil domain-containing protein [Eggerthellaceae bacterium]|jgi:peptidoglycan hydrolase CwlO-like protein